MTLDGFIADPDDSLDWLFRQPQDESGPLNYEEFIGGIGAIVMGATTYRWILAHTEHTGEAWSYDMPSWVMTHRDLPVPEISTFHALCVRVLRRHATRLGYPERFTICDRGDQEGYARGALREIRAPADSLKPVTL